VAGSTVGVVALVGVASHVTAAIYAQPMVAWQLAASVWLPQLRLSSGLQPPTLSVSVQAPVSQLAGSEQSGVAQKPPGGCQAQLPVHEA